jgi:hypothetical protein
MSRIVIVILIYHSHKPIDLSPSFLSLQSHAETTLQSRHG